MKALFRITLAVALLAMVAAPVTAQIIDTGVDLWRTRGNGTTYASFAINPLPAGFFCAGSSSFSGRIDFQGVPIATDPPRAFGIADTVIERLDRAEFNANGVATTRIRMRAMEFEGVQLLSNECGTYKVGVELVGEQPVTEMKIIKEQANGGHFLADVHVNVAITFTPMDHGGETLSVYREMRFGPSANAVWSHDPGPGFTVHPQGVQIDTDHDGAVDAFVRGTTANFYAGSKAGLRTPGGGVLHRGADSADRTDVAGQLKDGDFAPARAEGVSNVSGAAAEEISQICHIEDSCGHCPDGTTYALE